MDRTEALTAVLNAARVVRKQTPLGDYLPVHVGQCLAQLYSAIDAVDAVGAVPEAEATDLDYVSPPGRVVGHIRGGRYEPIDRPGICQGDPDCWRYADLPTGTCHHHSPQAHAPQVRRRDAMFEQGDADEQ